MAIRAEEADCPRTAIAMATIGTTFSPASSCTFAERARATKYGAHEAASAAAECSGRELNSDTNAAAEAKATTTKPHSIVDAKVKSCKMRLLRR